MFCELLLLFTFRIHHFICFESDFVLGCVEEKGVDSTSSNELNKTQPIVDDDVNKVQILVIIYLTDMFNRYDAFLL